MGVYIRDCSVISSAGVGVEALWDCLAQKRICSTKTSQAFPELEDQYPDSFFFAPSFRNENKLEALAEKCLRSCLEQITAPPPEKVGVIVASTKGCLEDQVWKEKNPSSSHPLVQSLAQVRKHIEERGSAVVEETCISNACTSAMSAVYLARKWIQQGRVDDVFIFAYDFVGPFVVKGFSSLRALSPDGLRPFSADRSGLGLGEAAALFLISSRQEDSLAELEDIVLDAEGVSATRPSTTGDSLFRCLSALKLSSPQIGAYIAHGTATPANDQSESRALKRFEDERDLPVEAVTGSKANVGHCLGASSAIDLCLGLEMIRRRRVFPMAGTIDFAYPHRFAKVSKELISPRVVISSLGFGGIHGAMSLCP